MSTVKIEMIKVEDELAALTTEVAAYNMKPNKSISARIRSKLGKLKKDVTSIRASLVEADKAGY